MRYGGFQRNQVSTRAGERLWFFPPEWIPCCAERGLNATRDPLDSPETGTGVVKGGDEDVCGPGNRQRLSALMPTS